MTHRAGERQNSSHAGADVSITLRKLYMLFLAMTLTSTSPLEVLLITVTSTLRLVKDYIDFRFMGIILL